MAGDREPAAPLVDVLLPAFNAAATIGEALDSLQAQTLKDLRIIVVDDGSTDETAAILKHRAAREPRIVVVSQSNGGIVSALNTGLAQSTAEFIARQDADDISDPQRLEVQVAYLRRRPDCVAVSSFARHIAVDGVPLRTKASFPDPAGADFSAYPSREPYLLHPFLFTRREALQRTGGYRKVDHAEDTDLYWRLRELGHLANIREVLGAYRMTPTSVTSRSAANGRLSAVSSQLAALSARRRARQKTDLRFDSKLSEKLRACADDPEALLAAASAALELDERTYLGRAFAAKMLELTSYRPYELSSADCAFVSKALTGDQTFMAQGDLGRVRRHRAIAVARLLRAGRLSDARRLASPSIVMMSAWRMAIDVVRRERVRKPAREEVRG